MASDSRRRCAGWNAACDDAARQPNGQRKSRRPAQRGCVRNRIPQCAQKATQRLQPRMGPQYRVQRGLILPDKRPGAIVFMPIRPKRENFLDGDDKKARLSVITRSLFFTPSSYLLDAKAPRGRARFFCAIKKIQNAAIGAIDPQRNASPTRPPCRANPSSLCPPSSNDYLEE